MDNPQQQLLNKISSLKTLVESYKETIEIHLADTNVPLEERWLVYQELPSFLRNNEYNQQDFLIKSDGSFIELCDVGEYSKYEMIQVHSFLQNKAKSLLDHSLDTVATKEYILKHNLGSFEND